MREPRPQLGGHLCRQWTNRRIDGERAQRNVNQRFRDPVDACGRLSLFVRERQGRG
jgi:hypothetical protein